MMTTDRQVELFELVRDTLKNTTLDEYDTGICQVVDSIYRMGKCNGIEHSELEYTLRLNKPKGYNQYVEFYHNEFWDDGVNGYWWLEMHIEPKTRQVRVEYLNNLIWNLKNKLNY